MKTDLTYGTPEEGVEYRHRKGAYLVAFDRGMLCAVRTKSGELLLPGGGLEEGENHEECLLRECLEETGCDAQVGDYLCSADIYYRHPTIGPFHQIQFYYHGSLLEQLAPVSEEEESEGIFLLPLSELDRLYLPIQRYAVEECMRVIRNDAFGYDSEDPDF